MYHPLPSSPVLVYPSFKPQVFVACLMVSTHLIRCFLFCLSTSVFHIPMHHLVFFIHPQDVSISAQRSSPRFQCYISHSQIPQNIVAPLSLSLSVTFLIHLNILICFVSKKASRFPYWVHNSAPHNSTGPMTFVDLDFQIPRCSIVIYHSAAFDRCIYGMPHNPTTRYPIQVIVGSLATWLIDMWSMTS